MQFPEDEVKDVQIVDDCSPQLRKYILGSPNKNGRFNIDIKAMKAAMEQQGREDRETFFASRFNKIT